MAQRTNVYGVRLTTREKEILQYVIKGMRTRQIADMLSISQNTVANHRKNLLKKKGARRCKELIPAA